MSWWYLEAGVVGLITLGWQIRVTLRDQRWRNQIKARYEELYGKE